MEVKRYARKKNPSWLFGTDRKIHPSGSLFGITRPNSDPEGQIFLSAPNNYDGYFFNPHLTFMKDSYNLKPFPGSEGE